MDSLLKSLIFLFIFEKKKMIDLVNSLDDLISKAISDKASSYKLELGELSEQEIERIKESTGIDVVGYKRVIDSSAVNHTLKNHGNAKKEKNRGQIAVETNDFHKISELVTNLDEIKYADKNWSGRDLLHYIKNWFDAKYHCIEEVRNGKKELALQTLYKQQKPQ